VLEILSRNQERLLDFMSKFHQDNDNEQVHYLLLHRMFPIIDATPRFPLFAVHRGSRAHFRGDTAATAICTSA
jgi:hypothetical protein